MQWLDAPKIPHLCQQLTHEVSPLPHDQLLRDSYLEKEYC